MAIISKRWRDIFMIKGIRKNVLVVKCGRESPFESATFVLREGAHPEMSDQSIIAEAERLVSDALKDGRIEKPARTSKKKKTK